MEIRYASIAMCLCTSRERAKSRFCPTAGRDPCPESLKIMSSVFSLGGPVLRPSVFRVRLPSEAATHTFCLPAEDFLKVSGLYRRRRNTKVASLCQHWRKAPSKAVLQPQIFRGKQRPRGGHAATKIFWGRLRSCP